MMLSALGLGRGAMGLLRKEGGRRLMQTRGGFGVSPPPPTASLGLGFDQTFREDVDRVVAHMKMSETHVPVIVNGDMYPSTPDFDDICPPHQTSFSVGRCCISSPEHIDDATQASIDSEWSSLPLEKRTNILMKAAELMASDYRERLAASIVLQQSKNYYEAQQDICTATDIIKNAVDSLLHLHENAAPVSTSSVISKKEFRPLGGPVACYTPYYSLSLSLHSIVSPLLMGNPVLWVPDNQSTMVSYLLYTILITAGLPKSALHFLPSNQEGVDHLAQNPHLGGVSFVGQKQNFNDLEDKLVSRSDYRSLVVKANLGGPGTLVAHKSADIRRTVVAMLRGGLEYSGQNHTSTTTAFLPKTMWREIEPKLPNLFAELVFPKTGSPEQSETFVNAVINRKAYNICKEHIAKAKNCDDARVFLGGDVRPQVGFYVDPTLIVTEDPNHDLLGNKRLKGPIVNICTYEDNEFEDILLNSISSSSSSNFSAAPAAVSVMGNDVGAVDFAKSVLSLQKEIESITINDKTTLFNPTQFPFSSSFPPSSSSSSSSLTAFSRELLVTENYSAPTAVLQSHME